MKKIYYLITLLLLTSLFAGNIYAQEVIVTDDAAYTTPASGAILDVKSTTQGFMAPRVALTATNAASPLTSPSTGLLVYNTATTSAGTVYDVTPGFYYNAGTPASPNWAQVVNATGAGTADLWDDLRVPLSAPSKGNVLPKFLPFPYNNAVNGNPLLNWFEDGAAEELYFVVQLPHDWDEGTNIFPHVHWVPSATSSGKVEWSLDYSWLNNEDTHSEYTTIKGDTTTRNITNLVANTQYITPLGSSVGMNASGKKISSMIICRLYRDATNGNSTDTYTGLAGTLEIDFHYLRNSMGSRLPFIK